jgi:hypothetical protein
MSAIATIDALGMDRLTEFAYGEPEYGDRFDPESYGPVARWERKFRRTTLQGVKKKTHVFKPLSEPNAATPEPEAPRTVRVRGRLIGADKTKLDESQTRAFLQFVAKAKKEKSAYRYRV